MELPNNVKVAGVIIVAVEALNGIHQSLGLAPMDAPQIAALWKRELCIPMLTNLMGIAMTHALVSLDPEPVTSIHEIRETFESMFLAYALHLRGDKDARADYATIRSMLQTRSKHAQAAGVVPHVIVKGILDREKN